MVAIRARSTARFWRISRSGVRPSWSPWGHRSPCRHLRSVGLPDVDHRESRAYSQLQLFDLNIVPNNAST